MRERHVKSLKYARTLRLIADLAVSGEAIAALKSYYS
jgi:hypothetical protein